MDKKNYFPTWLQEFNRFKALKSEFFLYGNIYDCYYFPINYKTAINSDELKFAKFNDIKELLKKFLKEEGYEIITYFDIIDGLEVGDAHETNPKYSLNNLANSGVENPSADFSKNIERARLGNRDIDLDAAKSAISLYRELMRNSTALYAGIFNFASRLTSNPNSLEDDVKPLFLRLIKAAQESKVWPEKERKRNILIFLCDKLNDIPAWMFLENPLTKGIEILEPNREERQVFFRERKKQFYSEGKEVKEEELMKSFPDLTENFSNRELEDLCTISVQEKMHINDMKEIIDLYKYGVKENPWEKIDFSKINNAAEELRKRVKGQDKAIQKAVEIIRRSNLGLDSIDKPKPSSRP